MAPHPPKSRTKTPSLSPPISSPQVYKSANTSTLENRSTSVSKKDSDIRSFPTLGIDDEGRCDIGADVSHHTILDAPNTISNDVSIDKTQTPRGQMPASIVLFIHHNRRRFGLLIPRKGDRWPEGVLSHPSDGEAWKHFDRCHRPFVADAPNMTTERNHHKVIQGKSTSQVSKLKFLDSSSIRVKLSSTSSFNFGTHRHRLVYESSERLSNLELFKKLCKKNRHEGDNCNARLEKVARAHGIIANVVDLALDIHLDPEA
ncbi:hypothetical protein Tco_1081238 [Tanacetum coccineum]|uniref:Uncharacterized protein n=1 Tax=Tanacetum coccineum TaxID=301880 RepID=A0ABQ5HYZ3_9ASTR